MLQTLRATVAAWRGPRSLADKDWDPWYDLYLESPQWRLRRRLVLWLHLRRCRICGKRATQVHHITYVRVGHEDLLNDLIPVCAVCHEHLHYVYPAHGRHAQANKKQTRRKRRWRLTASR